MDGPPPPSGAHSHQPRGITKPKPIWASGPVTLFKPTEDSLEEAADHPQAREDMVGVDLPADQARDSGSLLGRGLTGPLRTLWARSTFFATCQGMRGSPDRRVARRGSKMNNSSSII